MKMKRLLLLLASIFLLGPLGVHCELEWKILTKQNFSSQIRLHPHILLFVTLPWSGECRSLMKEVANAVADKTEFSSLKLMFMHKNTEKMLAESVGAATDEITILYYHHSLSYKYRGILRAKNILYSIYPYMSLAPEEVPLKSLKTANELRVFLDSTDKALVLVEFCGWAPKLLAKGKRNGTGNVFNMDGDILEYGFKGAYDKLFVTKGMNTQKVAGEGMCKAEGNAGKGFGEVPWFSELTSLNTSTPIELLENISSQVVSSCTFEEFQRFSSFFSNFMLAVREFFLPSERHGFGLVSNKSMLPHLGVDDSGAWLVVHYLTGCPSCSNILTKEEDLKHALQKENFVIKELKVEGFDPVPTLPADKASVLLFVDRSSDSGETRGTSKEALDAFRELAQYYYNSHQMGKRGIDKHGKSSIWGYQRFKGTSQHPRLKLPVTAQRMKLEEKISRIMIVNDGKHVSLEKVTSDLQVNSLHEILNYLLQRKEKKLSTLANELGFQLLSGDIVQQPESGVHLSPLPPESSEAGILTAAANVGNDLVSQKPDENSDLTDIEASSQQDGVKTTYIDLDTEKVSSDLKEFVAGHEHDAAIDTKEEEESSSLEEKTQKEEVHLIGFNGSFFFSDGNYRLLRALTGGSSIPALVIIDPIQQHHYVLHEEKKFSYSSLFSFLNEYLNGNVLPHQQSHYHLQGTRKATHPPFVNLNFHEVESIPWITADSYFELVIGFNLSDNEKADCAWSKDVLVLFSSSWCGFCQRMELVVREVYRAIKGYINMMKDKPRKSNIVSNQDNLEDLTLKLPDIYLMDCTLNDCSLILKSIDQKDVYPALVLFPAEKKNPILYEGDMSVTDVIKFVGDHGRNSHNLITVMLASDKRGWNQNLQKHASQNEVLKEVSTIKNKSDGVPRQDDSEESIITHHETKLPTPNTKHEMKTGVVVGSILIATERLLGIQPFDQSKILVVSANQITGFQGIAINKQMDWNSLDELEEGLEILKQAPLSFGGPLTFPEMPLVALTRNTSSKSHPEILPGVYFLNQLTIVHEFEELKSGNRSVVDYWFFLGYSSWGWDQLFDEIAEGAWDLAEDVSRHFQWP